MTAKRPRVLVYGDSILDRWVSGPATRVCPEGPFLVVNPCRERHSLGGAAAVAGLAASLGAEVFLISDYGRDQAGIEMDLLLREAGIKCLSQRGPRTTVKERIAAESHGHGLHTLLRVDRDQKVANVTDFCYSDLTLCGVAPDVILIADYLGGMCSELAMRSIMAWANDRNVPVLVDPGRGISPRHYCGATLLKMNRQEAELASGRAARYTMTTLDKDGAHLIDDAEGAEYKCPSLATNVVDVTGAGDSVLAALGLLFAYAQGEPSLPTPQQILAVAMRAAAQQLAQHGIGPLNSAVLDGTAAPPRLADVASEQDAAELRKWIGRPIVLAPGCFDLLHDGHRKVLRLAQHRAKAIGGVVVVALNSDDCVRRLKGELRPIQAFLLRATALLELDDVQFVVAFDENTPDRLAGQLQPEFIVKGDDHRNDPLTGGIETVYASRLPGFSTTEEIARRAGEIIDAEEARK